MAIMAGLLPSLWSTGTGSEVMRCIAVPRVDGMLSSALLILLVIPVLFALVKGRELKKFFQHKEMSMWGHMGYEGWGGMGIGMLLFLIVVIVVLVMMARCFMNSECSMKRNQPALDTLKQRYARGEIDKTEFEQKKRDLEN